MRNNMKKRIRAFSAALAIIISICPLAHNAQEATAFSIGPSEWAADQVHAAIAAGLVPERFQSGYTQTATRAEFCAFAVTLYEIFMGEIYERKSFNDTNDLYVEKAAAVGIVFGVDAELGLFDPEGYLTREQAATMLARLADVSGRPYAKQAPTFSDNHDIEDWAFSAVGQVQAAGVMLGTGDNLFSPKDPYTREQCMMTVLRAYNAATGKPVIPPVSQSGLSRLPYENPGRVIITHPGASSRQTSYANISILGASDYNHPLFMNGIQIPTTALGFFTVYVPLAQGANSFTFSNNGKEETVVITRSGTAPSSGSGGSGGSVAVPKHVYYDKPMFGMVKNHSVTHRASLSTSDILITPLAYGTTFDIVGEAGSNYIIKGGTYVFKDNVNAFNGSVPETVVTGGRAFSEGRFTSIVLDMNVNTFYTISMTGNKAKLTLRAVQDDSLTDFSGTLITNIKKTAGSGTSVYDIEFADAPVGHTAEFKSGQMTVSFLHAIRTLNGARIVLDAGHGGNDTGALGPPGSFGPAEKDFNLHVALSAKDYLEARGATVLLTRTGDVRLELSERPAFILAAKPDLSVSVHVNSMPVTSNFSAVTGPLMFFTFDESSHAAEIVTRTLSSSLGVEYKAPRRQNFALARLTANPAILLEMAFMCNPNDYEQLLVKNNLDRIGEALGKGVEAYFMR